MSILCYLCLSVSLSLVLPLFVSRRWTHSCLRSCFSNSLVQDTGFLAQQLPHGRSAKRAGEEEKAKGGGKGAPAANRRSASLEKHAARQHSKHTERRSARRPARTPEIRRAHWHLLRTLQNHETASAILSQASLAGRHVRYGKGKPCRAHVAPHIQPSETPRQDARYGRIAPWDRTAINASPRRWRGGVSSSGRALWHGRWQVEIVCGWIAAVWCYGIMKKIQCTRRKTLRLRGACPHDPPCKINPNKADIGCVINARTSGARLRGKGSAEG